MKDGLKYGLIGLGIATLVGGAIVIVKKSKKWKDKGMRKKVNCDSSFLFIGDSLTAFEPSYADQLKSICPALRIKKIAKVGEKTNWMLGKLADELKTSNKYDVISILGGVNDVYAIQNIEGTKKNLQAMYDMAKKHGASVVGITIPPTKTYKISNDKTVKLTKELNGWIRSNKTLDAVVDADFLLNDGNDGTKQEYLGSDTLHLTKPAHTEIMKDFSKKVLK